MKRFFLLLFLGTCPAVSAQVRFSDYFLEETMRFDYYHSGDSRSEKVFLRRPEGRTLLGGLARVAPRYDGLREPVFPHRRPRFRTGDLFARLLYALQRVAEHGRGRQRAPFLSRVGRIPLSQAPVPHRDLRPQCRGALRKAVQPEYRPRILLRRAVHAPLRDFRGGI